LLTRSFVPPSWSLQAYQDVWKTWPGGLKEQPKDFERLLRDRYGMHTPPYPNGKFPMGLREGKTLLGKGVSLDCMLCHAGSILGQSYVGLPNSSIDLQALFEDLSRAGNRKAPEYFQYSRVRGTTEAGAVAVFLLSFREPDLKLRNKPLDLGLRDD